MRLETSNKSRYLRSMRYIIFLISIFGLLLSCSKSKKATSTTEPSGSTTTVVQKLPPHTKTPISGPHSQINGTILEANGEPLPFATVILASSTGEQMGTNTDLDGQFEIKAIPIGDYTIKISYVGYVNQTYGPLRLDSAMVIHFELIPAEPIEVILLKPLIYLYPVDTIDLHVQLQYNGDIIHTYPRYGTDGWHVTAYPNGTLVDSNHRTYYGLYWEGDQNYAIVPTNGQVIAGHQSISFLESQLALLGLNEREANEFIMFWLPQMEKNPYNLVHFATTAYAQETPLKVSPQPDQVIRIMMTLIPLQQPLTFPIQTLESTSNVRTGFTLVEWGGQILSASSIGIWTQ